MSQTSDDESAAAGGQVASVEPAATLYPPASQSDESIRVLVRVRPNLQREEGSSQAVFVEGGKATASILSSRSLAYGQTSSGKTYTLFGPGGDTGKSTIAAAIALSRGHTPADPQAAAAVNRALGMVPRAINNLFSALQAKNAAASDENNSEQHAQYTVYCSFLQLYNEKVFDLLQDPRSPAATQTLAVHEHESDGVYVEGLSEYLVTSATDCLRLVAFGAANRAVRATSYNESSSRSHAILQLQIERQVSGDTRITRSKLNLVDLAGSERWDTNAPPGDGAHTSEMTHINLSLLTLSKCITSLAKRDRKRGGGGSSPRLGHPSTAEGSDRDSGAVHVPYRESKLTHLLKDALGGNSKTRLVCTLSPAMSSAAESFQTMIFADSAKRVMTHAKVNMSMLPDRVLVKLLQAEVERLRSRLLELGDVAGAFGKNGSKPPSTKLAIGDTQGGGNPGAVRPAPRDPSEVAAALVGMEHRLEAAQAENMRLKQALQSSGHTRGHGENGSSFFLTGVPGDGSPDEGGAGGEEFGDAQEHYVLGESSLLQLKEAMDKFFNLDIEEEDLQDEVRRLIPAAHTHWAQGYKMLAAAATAGAAAKAGSTQDSPHDTVQASDQSHAPTAPESPSPRLADSHASRPLHASPQQASGEADSPVGASTDGNTVPSSTPAQPAASGGRRPSSRAGHAGVVTALRQAASSQGANAENARNSNASDGGAQAASADEQASSRQRSTSRPTVAASSGNPPASPLTTPRVAQPDEGYDSHTIEAQAHEAGENVAQVPQRRPSPPTQPLPAVSPPPRSRGGAVRAEAAAAASASTPSSARRGELAPVTGAGSVLGNSGMLMRTRGRDGKLDATGGAASGHKSTVTLPPLGGALSPDDPEAREAAIAERLKEVQREVARREKLAAWMEEKAKRQEAMLQAAKAAEEAAEAEEEAREKARQKRARAVKKRLDRYKRKLEKQKAAEAAKATRSDAGSVQSAGKTTGGGKKKKKKGGKKGDGSSTAGPGSAGVHTPSSDAAGVGGGGYPGMGHFPFSPEQAAAMTPQMAYAMALQQQAAAAMAALQGGAGGGAPVQGGFNPAFLPPPAAAYPWLAGQQVHPALSGASAPGSHASSAAAMAAWPLLGQPALGGTPGDDDPNPVSVTTRDDSAPSARQQDVPWAPPTSNGGGAAHSTSMQGRQAATGMAAIAKQAEEAVQDSRGRQLLPTGSTAAEDDLVQSDSDEDFTLPVPLTGEGGGTSDGATPQPDVPLNIQFGGLSAPPVRPAQAEGRAAGGGAPNNAGGGRRTGGSSSPTPKREKGGTSPRPTTSSGGNAASSEAQHASQAQASARSARGHSSSPPAEAEQLSPRQQREQKAKTRQQQLAAVYAAPVVGKSRSSSRPKLRGLYNNAGFDREGVSPAAGSGDDAEPEQSRGEEGGYSDDDFEYEKAGGESPVDASSVRDQPDARQPGSRQPRQDAEADHLEQSAGQRIDAGAAGNLLSMLDEL